MHCPSPNPLCAPLSRWLTSASLFAALAAPSLAFAADVAPPGSLASWSCLGQCGASPAQGNIGLSPFASPAYGYVTTAGSTVYGASPLMLDSNSRGIEANGSRIVSAPFQALAGDRIDVQFNYASTDGKGFDDYAWARLVDAQTNALVAWLFTARSSNSSTGNIVPGDVLRREDFDPRQVIVNYDSFEFTSMTADNPIDWAPLGPSNGTCWRDNAQGCGFTGWLQSQYSFAQAGSYRLEVGVVNWGDEAYDSGLAFDVRGLVATVPEPAAWQLLLAALLLGALRVRKGRAAARP